MARMTVEEIYRGKKYDMISATALQTNAYGKRTPKNVYADAREECEKKLSEMIKQKNAEIAVEKERLGSGQRA